MLRTNWFHVLVAVARQDLHGAGIAQDVLEQTGGEIRLWPATLYRTLDEMVADGLLEQLDGSRHPQGESHRKRYYRATAIGRRRLVAAAEQMSAHAGVARDRLADRGR